jgi:hypothetical protein
LIADTLSPLFRRATLAGAATISSIAAMAFSRHFAFFPPTPPMLFEAFTLISIRFRRRHFIIAAIAEAFIIFFAATRGFFR